jgi:hypothetical protein
MPRRRKLFLDLDHLVFCALIVVWGLARFARPRAYTWEEVRQISSPLSLEQVACSKETRKASSKRDKRVG